MRLPISSCFVEYVLPSSGIILAIHYTLCGLCQIRPLDGMMYATKTATFWLHPPPMSLETYSFLYLLHISVSAIKGHHHHFHLCSKLVKSVFHFDLSSQSKEEDDLETMMNKQVENQSYHSCSRFSFKISLTFNKKKLIDKISSQMSSSSTNEKKKPAKPSSE